MSSELKKEFINECINNRIFLGYTSKDVANSLIEVSEEEYIDFEAGKYIMSSENIKRLMRVLCIEKPNAFDVNQYIDTTGLDEVELDDLSKIVKTIVGDDNA